MTQDTAHLCDLVEQQLELESRVVDTLETLNREMSSLLDDAGIYGPKESDLSSLSPLLETLRKRQSQSAEARKTISRICDRATVSDRDPKASPSTMREVIDRLPSNHSQRLDSKRSQLRQRMQDAQQRLTANQVVIFYSTEFHRRYLMGVLQCDVDDSKYKADGQAFKLPPEKIIGRNC